MVLKITTTSDFVHCTVSLEIVTAHTIYKLFQVRCIYDFMKKRVEKTYLSFLE